MKHDEVNWIPTTGQDPLEDYPRSVTSITFFFNSCLKTTLIYSLDTIRNQPIRDSGAPRFMFVVYGLELLVSVWFVSIVLVLVVACLCGYVSSPILVVPLHISFCMYHLSNRNMKTHDGCQCLSFTSFCIHHSSSVT